MSVRRIARLATRTGECNQSNHKLLWTKLFRHFKRSRRAGLISRAMVHHGAPACFQGFRIRLGKQRAWSIIYRSRVSLWHQTLCPMGEHWRCQTLKDKWWSHIKTKTKRARSLASFKEFGAVYCWLLVYVSQLYSGYRNGYTLWDWSKIGYFCRQVDTKKIYPKASFAKL